MDLTPFFKSVLDLDTAPVVLCDTSHIIVYMNRAAIDRYAGAGGAALLGKSVLGCHSPAAAQTIEKVLRWFRENPEHNRIYEFRNEAENKDVYMIALRDEAGRLIGYYEKHEYRSRETAPLYDF